MAQITESRKRNLKEIAYCALKLGTIGFGGIAGMVATIENEIVVKRKWIDHQYFMDVVSAPYIVPGPNAVDSFLESLATSTNDNSLTELKPGMRQVIVD